jgi:hypothetical protein
MEINGENGSIVARLCCAARVWTVPSSLHLKSDYSGAACFCPKNSAGFHAMSPLDFDNSVGFKRTGNGRQVHAVACIPKQGSPTGGRMNRYLINLDRSPERLARMRTIFEAMGLDFERVAAVDG